MQLPSLIFLDGGDPAETAQADDMLKKAGFSGIQGQTTNPTLIAKNPEVQKYLSSGKKLTQAEALNEYKKIVTQIARVTSGPISIQVIADKDTAVDDMLRQAFVYSTWIPNGVIKFPCTGNGLAAAEKFCKEWSINITLNFSQSQAAAVYVATRNSRHQVFISPFVGRLDDRGENGMQVVENELKMFQKEITHPNPPLQREGIPPLIKRGQGELLRNYELNYHVEVLTASLRTLEHLLYALQLKSSAITVPFKILKMWQETGFKLPDTNFKYDPGSLKPIPYQEITLDKDWRDYNLKHDLTDTGLQKFMADWQTLIR